MGYLLAGILLIGLVLMIIYSSKASITVFGKNEIFRITKYRGPKKNRYWKQTAHSNKPTKDGKIYAGGNG